MKSTFERFLSFFATSIRFPLRISISFSPLPFLGEYDQNLCPSRNTTCPPCPHRHANCKSLGNGTQPFSGKMWSSNFATCLLNRTINQSQCTNGFYHPVELTCKDVVRQSKWLLCLPLALFVQKTKNWTTCLLFSWKIHNSAV